MIKSNFGEAAKSLEDIQARYLHNLSHYQGRPGNQRHVGHHNTKEELATMVGIAKQHPALTDSVLDFLGKEMADPKYWYEHIQPISEALVSIGLARPDKTAKIWSMIAPALKEDVVDRKISDLVTLAKADATVAGEYVDLLAQGLESKNYRHSYTGEFSNLRPLDIQREIIALGLTHPALTDHAAALLQDKGNRAAADWYQELNHPEEYAANKWFRDDKSKEALIIARQSSEAQGNESRAVLLAIDSEIVTQAEEYKAMVTEVRQTTSRHQSRRM